LGYNLGVLGVLADTMRQVSLCAIAPAVVREQIVSGMGAHGINDAKHWRDRAAEMRALSDQIKDPQAQRMMLKLANDYDKLADRAEDRASRDKAGPSPIPKTKGAAA